MRPVNSKDYIADLCQVPPDLLRCTSKNVYPEKQTVPYDTGRPIPHGSVSVMQGLSLGPVCKCK